MLRLACCRFAPFIIDKDLSEIDVEAYYEELFSNNIYNRWVLLLGVTLCLLTVYEVERKPQRGGL